MGLRQSLALLLIALGAAQEVSAAGALLVWNMTDSAVTVNVNGVYGCNTSSGTRCSIPLADGAYVAVARNVDGQTALQNVVINNSTHKWCLFWRGNQKESAQCQKWVDESVSSPPFVNR
jgi:hypothetical protein